MNNAMKPYETQLHDALSQLVGWVEEGCHSDGREYALTEARSALKALQVIRGKLSEQEVLQLQWLKRKNGPAWGGHLERGEPISDPLMRSMVERDLIEIAPNGKGYIVSATGQTMLAQALSHIKT